MIRYALLVLALLVGVPVTAGMAAKTNKAPRELLQWLDRSLAAQRNAETLRARCSMSFGEVLDPAAVASEVRFDVLCRREPQDTVTGLWFSMRVEPETADGQTVRAIYDGDALYYVENDSVMSVLPAADASQTLLFLPGWQKRLELFRESLLLPDSLFRERYADQGWDVGLVTGVSDTLIGGRRCKLIRNMQTGTRPEFGVWFRNTELFALDAETALPVWHRTHFERTQHSKKTNDQVVVERMETFLAGLPVPDSAFRSPGLPIKTGIPLEQVTDTTLLRWNGGKDVLGRWPRTEYSDSTLRGQVVVIDFSYKGCGYCQLAMPVFDSLARVYGSDSRVQFLLVDPVDPPKTIQDYARAKQLPFPVLDVDERFAASFGIDAYPVFVILGPDGKQRFRQEGYPGTRERLAGKLGAELEKLLPR